jgi:hypothetical protein
MFAGEILKFRKAALRKPSMAKQNRMVVQRNFPTFVFSVRYKVPISNRDAASKQNGFRLIPAAHGPDRTLVLA